MPDKRLSERVRGAVIAETNLLAFVSLRDIRAWADEIAALEEQAERLKETMEDVRLMAWRHNPSSYNIHVDNSIANVLSAALAKGEG